MKHFYWIIVFGIISGNSLSALDVDYNIDTNSVWSVSDSPVMVSKADFTVNDSVRLIIEQGVVVNFVPSSGDVTINGELQIKNGAVIKMKQGVRLTIYGKIVVTGSSVNKVLFDEYETGQGWDGFFFRKNDSVYESTFLHAEIKNIYRNIAVTEQNVFFDSCSFIAHDFRDNLFIRTWGGITNPPNSFLHIANSFISVKDTNDCGGFGCDKVLIQLDGMDVRIENSSLNYVTNGENIQMACGVKGETSNTEPFVAEIINNEINVTSNTSYVLSSVYGVYYTEYTVSGEVSSNDIRLNTAMNGHGIYSYGGTLISNNLIKIHKTASGNSNIYGIYDLNTTKNYDKKISGNKIYLKTDSSHFSNYSFTGIYMQSGKAVNNVVSIQYLNDVDHTKIKGIDKNIYTGSVENNTIQIDHISVSDDVKGIYLGNHPNTSDSISVRNNIVVGSNQANTIGLYKESTFAAVLGQGYNLIYNFGDIYFDITDSAGLVTEDPLFADTLFTLDSLSPAIDAGDPGLDYSAEPEPNGGRINIGAYGNTQEAAVSWDVQTSLYEIFENTINIFPNPTKNSVNISVNEQVEKIEILNSSGVMVYKKIKPVEKVVDLSTFRTGIYVFLIYSRKGVMTKKIVKN